jgi:hypothetical protein
MKHTIGIGALLIGLMTSSLFGTATAQDLPYQTGGFIEAMDLPNNTVVINDTIFEIAPFVIVRDTARGTILRRDSLKKGMYVGFNMLPQSSGPPYIKEMWIIEGD